MPTSEIIPVATEDWTREGALFVEPRLRELGVRHGLTARSLGPMGPEDARRAAAREAGLTDAPPLVLKQVHGKTIYEPAPERANLEGDGWFAGPGASVGVFVADCVPLFVWDAGLTRLAVVHAGWRGIAAGIGEAAVKMFGSNPAGLSAALGPHIGLCCYEVGPELKNDFDSRHFDGNRLDLGAALRARLEASGVPAERIGVSDLCTRCREEDFFSFRRDGIRRNMMAFAALSKKSAAGVPR
jgi:YfiH family protein